MSSFNLQWDIIASEEPIDERPLFFRLKEVRDKAQAEKDEQFALSK